MHATTDFFRGYRLLPTTFAWRSLTTGGTCIIQPSRSQECSHSQCCCVAFSGAVMVTTTTHSSFSHACACHVYIHVVYVGTCTYRNSIIKCTTYYDPCRNIMGIFLQQSCCLFRDKILRQFGNNVLPSFTLSTSPYINRPGE